jgi:rod shape-determining protein MreC
MAKNNKIIIAILLITIFSFSYIYQTKIKNLVYSISFPLQKRFWNFSLKLSNFYLDLINFHKFREENYQLIEENLKLKNDLILLQQKQKEVLASSSNFNQNLQKKLNLLPCQPWGNFSQDIIFVDKGSKDGLIEELTVISQNNVLIGKVIKVFENFSQVQLITANNFSFDIQIGDKETLGLAKGIGNNKLLFDLVPKESEIKIGDIVKTSSISGKFFPGLIVGKIKTISAQDNTYLKGEIEPEFLNLKDKLSTLFVIK